MESFPAREAERLLKKWGVSSLPVDLLKIAEKHCICCQRMPSKEGGVSGILVQNQGNVGILYSTHLNNDGFERFSIAHELGHYFLPKHPEAVFANGPIHQSRAGFVSDNQYEIEADHFASGLLMPDFLFCPALDKAGEGLGAIKSLSTLCRSSRTATAIRYAQKIPDPAAIVVSIGSKVDYCFMSDELREFPSLTWLKKGVSLPRGTMTFQFNRNSKNVASCKEAEEVSSLSTWFNSGVEAEIYEEVMGLGAYGKTLTVLTISNLPDPEEIEEETELIESWTPRFRR